jgi:tetratricopeptide (TPR) repeat protein
MRRTAHLLLIALLLAACGGWRGGDRLMSRADSLMYARPDAALALLDSIPEADRARMSKGQRMRYELLRADAQNKNFVKFTTDSVLKAVVSYYDSHGTPNERMRANYLLGRAYYDMGETPLALKYYHEAADCADTTQIDCDYKLLSRVHGQMGYLFLDQFSPNNALEEFDAAQRLALMCNDTLMYISNYSFKGSAYEYLNMPDSALSVKRNANRFYKHFGYVEEAGMCMAPVFDILVERGDLNEVASRMAEYERVTNILNQEKVSEERIIYFGTKGRYYLKVGKLDSALFYFNKLLSTATVSNHFECGYRGKSEVYNSMGVRDSALKYSLMASEWKDSCYREKSTSYYQLVKAQYNYSRNQQLAERAIKAKDDIKMRIHILFVALVILLFLIYFLHRRYRESLQHEKKVSELLSQLTQKKLELEGKLIRSEEEKQAEVESLEAKLAEYKKTEKYRKRILQEAEINDSDIVKTFRRYGIEKVHHPTLDEWASLQKFMCDKLPDFMSVIMSSKSELNEFEIQLCLLRRIQISLPDISFIMNRDSNLLSVMRRRILVKLFGTCEGGAKELDRRLLALW